MWRKSRELATFRVWEKVPKINVLSYESTLRILSTQCSEGSLCAENRLGPFRRFDKTLAYATTMYVRCMRRAVKTAEEPFGLTWWIAERCRRRRRQLESWPVRAAAAEWRRCAPPPPSTRRGRTWPSADDRWRRPHWHRLPPTSYTSPTCRTITTHVSLLKWSKKFDKKAASPPHMDGSTVFARWRQCAPPSNIWLPGPSGRSIPDGISIGPAGFAQLTADRPYALQSAALPLKISPFPWGILSPSSL